MRRGRGTPVVCLHAIGHGARDFEPLAELIGEDFEIIALDWPGQGRSPPDRNSPSAQRYSEILIAALDALQLQAPILIGNPVAQCIVGQVPDVIGEFAAEEARDPGMQGHLGQRVE